MFDRLFAVTLVGFLCCVGVQTQGNSTEKALEVRAVYPQGEEVSPYQRITVEFNQKVVALGTSMFVDDEVPIDIEPALDCEWNWVKQDTLKCELPGDSNLNASTQYTVTVRPGIKGPNGQTLDTAYVHTFQTFLPSILRSELVSWVSPTQPIIKVTFNQIMNVSSLRDRFRFKDSVSGEIVSSVVQLNNWNVLSALRRDYFGRAKHYQGRILGGGNNNSRLNEFLKLSVLVRPQGTLSPGADVSLTLLPGVLGANGNLKSTQEFQVNTDITTYEEFRLLGLRCEDISGSGVFVKIDEPTESACDVNSDIQLVFSSEFAHRELDSYVHTQPPTDTRVWRFFPREGVATESELEGFAYSIGAKFEASTTYRIYVAETIQRSNGTVQQSPVQDGFGRSLIGNNEITFQTGPPAPRAYLNGTNVVVDSNGTVDPQIVIGNIDDVTVLYDALDEVGPLKNQSQQKQSPKQDDVLQAQFLGLRDMLRSPSGIVIGNIDGQPRFEHPKKVEKEYFFVQATPYSVFLKLGTVASIAWVVDFNTGEPIADANVEFFVGDPSDLSQVNESIHSGVTDKDGLVSLPGYESFDPHWNRVIHEINRACPDDEECAMYFVRVETDNGMSLLPLDSDFILQGDNSTLSIYRNIDHWTTTSQKLYSPGDTVHIKGYVRSVRNEVRVIPTTGHFALCIVGPGAREYEIAPILLNQFGAYDVELKLNKHTELGEYVIDLLHDPTHPITEPCSTTTDGPGVYTATGGSFEVFEFKTNPIRVTQQLNAMQFERGDSMSITSTAELHAGGPYSHATGQLEIWLQPRSVPFETVDTDSYVFLTRDENVRRFNREYWADIQLDATGLHTYTIDSLTNDLYYGEYWITTSVISDRGKSVAARISVPYFGVDQFVGIDRNRSDEYWFDFDYWVNVNEPWPIQVVVLSKDDEIVSGKEVQIKVFKSQLDPELLDQTSLYASGIRWKEIFDCTLESALSPVSCDFIPSEKNYYRIDAQIVDTKGNTHRSSYRIRARADKRPPLQIAQPTDTVKIELNCDSVEVEVGDVVRCTVENHLSNSAALVTIERSAVIDKWLVRLESKNPAIEFTVLEDYAPHFELSVLSVSPTNTPTRTEDARYRFGNQKFTMNNPHLESIPIVVSTNSEFYSPRDRVELSLSIDNQTDGAVPIEYTVAVVDESLLDLGHAQDEYFDPTRKRWSINTTGLRTYGLIASLMEESGLLPLTPEPYSGHRFRDEILVTSHGSRVLAHEFTKEGTKDPDVRTLDRFIAYWNPSIVSSNGQQTVAFDLPDNLTSWKVLVLAVSAKDQFGFTSTTFGTIKDTEIRAVAPNVVTEGDTFHVGASILNRADSVRDLTVELQASGLLDDESKNGIRQQLEFKPFERKVVTWEVQAGIRPTNFQEISRNSEIRVVASAGDNQDRDALDIRIPVRPKHVRVSSVAYGALADDTTTIPIEVPAKLATEDGQLDLTLTTNETVNFDGVYRYVIEYPYTCWEQKLTQAILAMQYIDLEERGAKHGIEWPDPEATIVQALDSAVEFQAPNGGMAYFVPRNRDTDAYLSAYTALAFSWLADAGHEIPPRVNRKLLDYLRTYLADQEEEPSISHMNARISAVILHALALSGELRESDLTQFADHLNQLDLFSLAQYLQASLLLNSDHPLNGEIFDRIMNHRSLVDGVVEFIESVPLIYTQMLHSDTRSLCSVLSALTNYSATNSNGLEIGELKELSNSVRHARESSPCWLSTQDNVFCTRALIAFADYVEPDVRDLIATIALQSTDTGSSVRLASAWQFNSDTTRLHTLHPMTSQTFGSKGKLEINREGIGTAFYSVELSYLTTIDEQINRYSGFEVHREYFVSSGPKQWELLKPGNHVNKGDYVLVNIFLNNRFTRYHVVVDDSVPGGLEPVNRYLGTEYSSYFDRSELEDILRSSKWYQNFKDTVGRRSNIHNELGLQNVRFYTSSLGRGKHHLTWLGQAISAGEFTVLPTHVEEMYRPVMFGKSEPWTLTVKTESP